ncbi:MAG TPA: hypothetical protein VME66_15465 [Candidatus Acidoferrales bacterium]|nr:hypothetical protein [Candidatus Acidoferrales bacterium]
MSTIERPVFSEGQLLSAADLQLTVDYPRGELETHCSVAHTSGVVDGMTYQFIPPASPQTTATAVVTAGLAVDDQGRQIVIGSPLPIAPDPLAGQPSGSYPGYVWYSEATVASSTTQLSPCTTSAGDRVQELANVGVFLSDSQARAQYPDAVCLGYLGWTGTTFQAYTGSTPDVRQGGGVRAHEIVAPAHLVLAHAEDQAPTTLCVKGTLQAITADDGTAPLITAPGGSIDFCATAGAPATSSVSLSYTAPSATGNGLVIDLGNNDPTSCVNVESEAGTVLASVDGTGTVTAKTGAFSNVDAATSVVVTTGTTTLTLGATQPKNIAGITASDTLALAFGTASGDEVTFIAGAAPVATIDQNALTMTATNVKLGIVASGATGLAVESGDDLQIQTASGDLLFNPGSQTTPPFRLTAKSRLLNQTVSPPADVTPLTSSSGAVSVLQLGSLCVVFGTATASVTPLTQAPAAITFPITFASPPAFFVAVCGQSLTTIAAVAVEVKTTEASYRVTRLDPTTPANGDGATWSNAAVDVAVSWLALGSHA